MVFVCVYLRVCVCSRVYVRVVLCLKLLVINNFYKTQNVFNRFLLLGVFMPPAYLKSPDAAAYIGVSHRALEGLRYRGTGPKYSKVGRSIFYSVKDLDVFMASRRVDVKDSD